MKKKIVLYLSLIVLFKLICLKYVLGITSTNFQIPYFDIGPTRELKSESSNFQIESFIGDPLRGEVNSSNYSLDHGFFYPQEDVGVVRLSFRVIPEKRNPPSGNNSTRAILIVRRVNSSTIVYKTTSLIDTDNNGYSVGEVTLNGVNPGVYDVYIKGFSHLYIKKPSVTLNSGSNFVDFSNGGVRLALAGDVNIVNPNDPLKEGDDYVNSIDMGILVNKLFYNSNIEKEDLNKDGIVNSVDLGIAITNIFKYGDRP